MADTIEQLTDKLFWNEIQLNSIAEDLELIEHKYGDLLRRKTNLENKLKQIKE